MSPYFGRTSHIREFPSKNPAPPNLNRSIFEHRPTDIKVYPLGATLWARIEVAYDEMPFYTPLDLQRLLGLMATFNVVLP